MSKSNIPSPSTPADGFPENHTANIITVRGFFAKRKAFLYSILNERAERLPR
jgi:hypothetical protein